MMYEQLMDLFRHRRTVRYASTTDISQDHIDKILAAANLAPSFDKLYPYKIYALTNSPEGKAKKELMLEYFRCGRDRPFSGWANKEILQPVLSGLVLAYTHWNSLPRTPDPAEKSKYGFGIQDAMISGTMAMMAAESLGLKTSFLISPKSRDEASIALTGNSNEQLLMLVTVSNGSLDRNSGINIEKIKYKNQWAHIFLKKHRAIVAGPTVNII